MGGDLSPGSQPELVHDTPGEPASEEGTDTERPDAFHGRSATTYWPLSMRPRISTRWDRVGVNSNSGGQFPHPAEDLAVVLSDDEAAVAGFPHRLVDVDDGVGVFLGPLDDLVELTSALLSYRDEQVETGEFGWVELRRVSR